MDGRNPAPVRMDEATTLEEPSTTIRAEILPSQDPSLQSSGSLARLRASRLPPLPTQDLKICFSDARSQQAKQVGKYGLFETYLRQIRFSDARLQNQRWQRCVVCPPKKTSSHIVRPRLVPGQSLYLSQGLAPLARERAGAKACLLAARVVRTSAGVMC